MPNPSNPSGPFSPLQSFFAPWLFAIPTNSDDAKIAEAGPIWGPALESQARLWSQFIDMQRKIWSFYNPLLQNTPIFMNGATKTVAEDEVGLEPAETVDGIPDAFELQARTWNHFLDANRSFWTSMSWPTLMSNATATDTAVESQNDEAADNEATERTSARSSTPFKKARARR